MIVVTDNIVTKSADGVTSVTDDHTCIDASNSKIIGIVMHEDGSGANKSDFTYGGVSMEHVVTRVLGSSYKNVVSIWEMLHDDIPNKSGSNEFIATVIGSGSLAASAVQLTGAKQELATVFDDSGEESSTTVDCDLLNVLDGAIVISAVSSGLAVDLSVNPGTKQVEHDEPEKYTGGWGTYEVPADSGSLNVEWTANPSANRFAMVAAMFEAAQFVPAVGNVLDNVTSNVTTNVKENLR